MEKLNEARETYGFRTSDHKIFFKDEKNPSSKPLFTMINVCDK